MNLFDVKEFTIEEPVGVRTIGFAITYTKPEEWLTSPICKLDKLEYIESEKDGRKRKTFSVMSEEEEPNLLLVSLAKSRGIITYGKLSGTHFIPIGEHMNCEYSGSTNVVGEPMDYKFKYNPKRPIIIIDIENAEQVEPELRVDENKNMIGNYKLIPYKKYIALELAIRPIKNRSDLDGN